MDSLFQAKCNAVYSIKVISFFFIALKKSTSPFARKLINWHRRSKLGLVYWKNITDPYPIWLREVILQQTRIEQGIPYFERFIKKYPSVLDLANAPDDEVFRLWQGLGYYTRCRNILHTARYIRDNYHGEFPPAYTDIIKLKGIGRYTAAAIASFAFRLPYAVVDGNVIRVISRVFGSAEDGKTLKGQKWFEQKAGELLPPLNPGEFNQALMDLGANLCTPLAPQCSTCPFQPNCIAYQKNQVHLFPVKTKKKALQKRYFHFLIPENENFLYLIKREENDIWHSLYTPIMAESDDPKWPELWKKISSKPIQPSFTGSQALSHQKIHGFFYEIPEMQIPDKLKNQGIKVSLKQITQYAFPRLVISFFEKNNYL